MVLVSLTTLSMGRVAAQPEPPAPGEEEDRRTQQIDEITVVGQRSLRELRLEVQLARERVYDLFNSLNSNDEFDILCRNAPTTGSRILQRVCRPQYAENATSDAGRDFARTLVECGLTESCLELATSRAQVPASAVPIKDQQLAAEVQRLTRESRQFRRAIAEYQAVERRYAEARLDEGPALRASASILAPGAAVPSGRAPLSPLEDGIVAPRPGDLVTPEVSWGGRAGGAPRAVLPFEADVEMTIPAAWGECALFVNGRPDTTFTLYEFSEPVP